MMHFFDGVKVVQDEIPHVHLPTYNELLKFYENRGVWMEHLKEMHRRNDLLQAKLDESIGREARRELNRYNCVIIRSGEGVVSV